jgi:glutamine synthetase
LRPVSPITQSGTQERQPWTTAKTVLKKIKDKDVKYVDLRFTDPRGKMQHVTFDVSIVDEERSPKA